MKPTQRQLCQTFASMDKTQLRGQLQTIKNNFALVQLGVALMAEPDALTRFDRTLETLKDYPETESFSCIRYIYQSDELLKLATNQFGMRCSARASRKLSKW